MDELKKIEVMQGIIDYLTVKECSVRESRMILRDIESMIIKARMGHISRFDTIALDELFKLKTIVSDEM